MGTTPEQRVSDEAGGRRCGTTSTGRVKWDNQAHEDLLIAMWLHASPDDEEWIKIMGYLKHYGYPCTVVAIKQHLMKLRKKVESPPSKQRSGRAPAAGSGVLGAPPNKRGPYKKTIVYAGVTKNNGTPRKAADLVPSRTLYHSDSSYNDGDSVDMDDDILDSPEPKRSQSTMDKTGRRSATPEYHGYDTIPEQQQQVPRYPPRPAYTPAYNPAPGPSGHGYYAPPFAPYGYPVPGYNMGYAAPAPYGVRHPNYDAEYAAHTQTGAPYPGYDAGFAAPAPAGPRHPNYEYEYAAPGAGAPRHYHNYASGYAGAAPIGPPQTGHDTDFAASRAPAPAAPMDVDHRSGEDAWMPIDPSLVKKDKSEQGDWARAEDQE